VKAGNVGRQDVHLLLLLRLEHVAGQGAWVRQPIHLHVKQKNTEIVLQQTECKSAVGKKQQHSLSDTRCTCCESTIPQHGGPHQVYSHQRKSMLSKKTCLQIAHSSHAP
jgi:hypothetical protein